MAFGELQAEVPGMPDEACAWDGHTLGPSVPSPLDAGERNATSPADPSLTPGIARVIRAKASVTIAITS